MSTFVNLCPHVLRLRTNADNKDPIPDQTDIVVEPFKGEDGRPAPARVSTMSGGALPPIEGVAVFGRTAYGAVEGLPDPKEGVIYLVSALVAGRPEVAGRDDVFVPGTGPKDGVIRDAAGQVHAVTRLVQA